MHSPLRCSTLALAASLFALVALSPAQAADTAPSEPAPAAAADKLAPARALIAQSRWRDAIAALQQVNDTRSADWNNLMGYSHRKARTPDLPAAERYYDEALRINPQHRGALEYSGEMYLMLGELARAEARAATLRQVCGGACPELAELEAAISAHKASGPRVVAKP
jgi:tetratricopeptide (TPR) repeat protein